MSGSATRAFTRDGGAEVEVDYSWHGGSPAITSGPPECCDPGEAPEIEIDRVTLNEDGSTVTLSDEETDRFFEEVLGDPDALDSSDDYEEADRDDERD